MTFFYQTQTWNSQPQVTQKTIDLWKHVAEKKNWRIVQLPNGFYQTEHQDHIEKDTWHDVTRRETLEGAEQAIDLSVEHYAKKLEFMNGPKIVKTFK
jgi:SRSO17 transposase|tara:strand:+ start:518 stop:808 length:291 start_codon:yes stop_codon:yes gene_type:complete